MQRKPETPGWEVEIAQVKTRLDAFESELRSQGQRQQEGFDRIDRNLGQIFARVDAATTKPPPWGLIVSAFVGLCTILIGIGGLGMTLAGGLALWANAYFGKNIAIAEARADTAHVRLDRYMERVDGKLDQLKEFEWQTRADFSSWPHSSGSRPAPASAESHSP